MVDVAAPALRRQAWTSWQWVVVASSCVVGVAVRWIGLGSTVPTFDESFTGMLARAPLGDIPHLARTSDSHPPLDYLLRHLTADSGDAFWLRAPSALIGVATLLVVLWWMRDRGWFGVFVVAMTSVAAIQVLYARQARMYALVILAGTVVAVMAERWIDRPRARWAVIAAVALAVGLLSHTSTVFLALGALALPGLRTDREAWVWRASMGAAACTWLALWGPGLTDQIGAGRADWIPYTTPRHAVDAVAGQVSLFSGLAVVATAATIFGGVVLLQRHKALGRVWVCLFALPAAAVVVVGLWQHLLLPRTLAFAAWAPVVAIGAIAGACVDDRPAWLSRATGLVGVAACGLIVAASIGAAVTHEEDSAPTRRALLEMARPGDVVAVYPEFLAPMLEWDHDADPTEPPAVLEGDDVWFGVVPGAAPTGVVWLVVPETYAYDLPPPFVPCDDPPSTKRGDLLLSCYSSAGAVTG
jgi:hypothetical protein